MLVVSHVRSRAEPCGSRAVRGCGARSYIRTSGLVVCSDSRAAVGLAEAMMVGMRAIPVARYTDPRGMSGRGPERRCSPLGTRRYNAPSLRSAGSLPARGTVPGSN